MRPWSRRASEVANNLSPSFVAVVLHEGARGYLGQAEQPMPFELSFLMAPVALHSEARASLPRTTRAALPTWLLENAALRAQLADRACAMTAVIRESLLWGGINEVLRIDRVGVQPLRSKAIRKYLGSSLPEIGDIADRAHFLGKWLAKSGSTATVMAMWGVRP
jgi:hypothetical protein